MIKVRRRKIVEAVLIDLEILICMFETQIRDSKIEVKNGIM